MAQKLQKLASLKSTYHDATPYHDKEIYDEWVSPRGGKELNLAPFVPFHGQGVAASVFLMLDDSTKSQKYLIKNLALWWLFDFLFVSFFARKRLQIFRLPCESVCGFLSGFPIDCLVY